jgi:hypothetical protein
VEDRDGPMVTWGVSQWGPDVLEAEAGGAPLGGDRVREAVSHLSVLNSRDWPWPHSSLTTDSD